MAAFLSTGVHPEAARVQHAAREHASAPLPAPNPSNPHVLLEVCLAPGAVSARGVPDGASETSPRGSPRVAMTLELFDDLAPSEVARLRSRLLPGAPGSLVGAPMRLDASETALVFAQRGPGVDPIAPSPVVVAAAAAALASPASRVPAAARACLRHSARGAASLSRDGRELTVALQPLPALDADRVVVGRVVPSSIDGGAALAGLERAETVARRSRTQRRDLAWLEAGEPCGPERLRVGAAAVRAGKRDALAMDATGEAAREGLRDAVAKGLQKREKTADTKKRKILGVDDDSEDDDREDDSDDDEDDEDDENED